VAEFAFMVGRNDCIDSRRQPGSNEWVDGTRDWDARYFMNGFGIVDTGRSGPASNGNVRVFDAATGKWHVTFYSMPTYSSGVWKGCKTGDDIVLEKPQKALGTTFVGVSRLTFHNIREEGFDSKGEWVSDNGLVVFPFWTISCRKLS
jgi:hypothetical protein